MEEITRLTGILYLLESQAENLNSNLSKEEMIFFRSELTKLRDILQTTDDTDNLNVIAQTFFKSMSQIEYLQGLAQVDGPRTRFGSKEEIEDRIKDKLVKSCEIIIGRTNSKEA